MQGGDVKAVRLPAILVCVFGISVAASADPWTTSADANLTLTENAYSDNWEGGEAGALSWVFNANGLAERQLHHRVHNRNTLKLAFGQVHTQVGETDTWSKPEKSTDLIELETVFRFTLGGFVDPFASGRLESQFLDASDPAEDRLFNPLTLTESFGLAWMLIDEEKRDWTARLGAGLRQHIDRDALVDSVAGTRETRTSTDEGLEFVTEFTSPLARERITLASKLTVFKALFYSESDEVEGLPSEDYWKAPDINWENVFTAGITKYLMVSLYLQLLYDKEIDLAGRLKQTLSLGLTYKLS
jgi:hypothetical protein